jgi:hypothetical protein
MILLPELNQVLYHFCNVVKHFWVAEGGKTHLGSSWALDISCHCNFSEADKFLYVELS